MSINYALVTGAATGIGLATSKLLTQNGYHVFSTALPDQDTTELENVQNVEIVRIDITNQETIDAGFKKIESTVGDNGLSVLVNNAGIANIGSGVVEGVSMKDAKFLFEVNVFGTLRMVQKFLPLLRKFGPARMVNLASGAVRTPVSFAGIYNMSKFAVEGLTNSLRYELAPFGIQVTSIEPSAVKSEMTANHEENLEKTWQRMPQFIQDLYREPIKPTQEFLAKQIVKADPPEIIAKKILEVLQKKKMKMRYTAGSLAGPMPIMVGILGENGFEKLMMKMFRVPKNKFMKKE